MHTDTADVKRRSEFDLINPVRFCAEPKYGESEIDLLSFGNPTCLFPRDPLTRL
jgi:hypothetical protein